MTIDKYFDRVFECKNVKELEAIAIDALYDLYGDLTQTEYNVLCIMIERKGERL